MERNWNSISEIKAWYLPQIWEYEDCGDRGDADNLRKWMNHDIKAFERSHHEH